MEISSADKSLAIISHKYHVQASSGFVVKGGFQTLTDEIARHFQTVNLCVPVANGNAENGRAYRENIEVTPFPPFQGRKALLSNLPKVLSVMWKTVRRADIVYCMGPNDVGILAMIGSSIQRKKMFASLDTDRAGNVLRMDYGFLEKYVKYGADRFILYPIIRFLCNNVPVFVSGNMFMGEYQLWTQWVKSTLRRKDIPPKSLIGAGGNEEEFHIVFAGRLAPVKNLRRLIRAIHLLSSSNKSVRCTIIGSGELKSELEKLTNSLGAPVDFAGQVPNGKLIDSRFLGADLLALPSLEERQGKVLLEAMACSIPVVASRAGGIPTIINHEVNGLLCNPKKVEDIASKIDRLMKNKKLRNKLIINGYEYSKKHVLDIEVKKLMDKVFSTYSIKRNKY